MNLTTKEVAMLRNIFVRDFDLSEFLKCNSFADMLAYCKSCNLTEEVVFVKLSINQNAEELAKSLLYIEKEN